MTFVQQSTKFAAVVCFLMAATLTGIDAKAQEKGQNDRGGNLYVPLNDALVVNYGGPGRLKYLRAEVSLRVSNASYVDTVRHHLPLIQGNMILLFSRQEDKDVNTQEGRQRLRELAVEETNALLVAEEGKANMVRDVLFNNFVVQR